MFDITDFGAVEIVDYDNLSSGASFNAPGVDYVSPESLQLVTIDGKHYLFVGFEGGGTDFAGSIGVFEVTLAVIPEPSAFAALAGLATLTMATWHRRRAAVQIRATM